MADPLSLLLGQKKTEKDKVKPKPSEPPALQASSKPGGLFDFDDVSATLGRSRQAVPSQSAQPSLGHTAVPYPSEAPRFAATVPSTSYSSVQQPAQAPPTYVSMDSSSSATTNAGPTFEDMLPGEKVFELSVVKNCFLRIPNPFCEVRGRLLATNFRLKFQTPKGTLRKELEWMKDARFFDVPMGLVEDIKDEKSTTITGAIEYKLTVKTKDLRQLIFLVTTEQDLRNVIDAVTAFSTPGNPTLLFAFKHFDAIRASAQLQEPDGWNIYDPLQEYTRMGIETEIIPNPSSPWRVSNLNRDYQLCSSYPAVLALPRSISDQALRAVAGFRKRGRLPALSWCGGPELDFASLWRCSQTTEGLMGQKCQEDQNLVECIRRGPMMQDRDLLVIDLRPWKSAWANKAGGGGFEGYPRCKLVFGGIDNIHVVRDGWRAMTAAVNAISDAEVGSWIKDVANSGWYDYIGAILKSTQLVLKEILDLRSSVMVHCSDGWDRTAQVTSLSMLCLDSHYRTQAGFLKLVQKEWCSFGHRFRTRLALGEAPSQEYSPVFIQWLECVYQILRQFPDIFEYTPAILLRLAHEAFSNCYGTFLCDNEQERRHRVVPNTVSLWTVLLQPDEVVSWRNPNYVPDRKPFIPAISQVNYEIWEGYWFRYHVRGDRSKGAILAQSTGFGQRAWNDLAGVSPSTDPTSPAFGEVDPFEPTFTGKGVPTATSTTTATPTTTAPTPTSQSEAPSLFKTEELLEPKRAPPKQVFGDDDDDDIFSKPKA